jgi:hypothetical protein
VWKVSGALSIDREGVPSDNADGVTQPAAIDTDAATTAQLLADRAAIAAASTGADVCRSTAWPLSLRSRRRAGWWRR